MNRTDATQAAQGLLDFLTANPPANDMEQAALTRLTTDWEGSVDIAAEVLDSAQAQTTAPGTWETRDLFTPEQLAEAGTTPRSARVARETAAPQPGDRVTIIRGQEPYLPGRDYVGLTGTLIGDHSANAGDLVQYVVQFGDDIGPRNPRGDHAPRGRRGDRDTGWVWCAEIRPA